MSLFGDIVDTVGGWFKGSGGSSILGGLASTAVTGLALYMLNKSTNNSQPASTGSTTETTTVDYGTVVNVPPSTDFKIPVLYGSHHFTGAITEAVMSSDNKTMTYVITLCEKTGIKFSDQTMSTFTFNNIYWNNNRIVFNSDGITAHYTQDNVGNIDRNIDGLVKVYCYAGSSTDPVLPNGYTSAAPLAAYNYVPGWTESHTMDQLIFAVVKVTYNKPNNITELGDVRFHITNSMNQPGDCLYDYMTNTRYGAGIPAEDIYLQ